MYDLAELGFLTNEVRTPNPNLLVTARYSCVYWVNYLCELKPKCLGSSVSSLQAADVVEDFLKKKYLY
jgi:hypothetical protein